MGQDGSSAGPEAAARHAGCAARRAAVARPGEDRHLTRHAARYAPGCWWGGAFHPHRLPSGERLLFANPRHANSGDSIVERMRTGRFLNEKKPSQDCSPSRLSCGGGSSHGYFTLLF